MSGDYFTQQLLVTPPDSPESLEFTSEDYEVTSNWSLDSKESVHEWRETNEMIQFLMSLPEPLPEPSYMQNSGQLQFFREDLPSNIRLENSPELPEQLEVESMLPWTCDDGSHHYYLPPHASMEEAEEEEGKDSFTTPCTEEVEISRQFDQSYH
jgi:hypothetical protein